MMRYEDVADKITQKSGVTHSTMMKSSCLRYKGDFIEMMFEKKDSLIIIVALDRVDELIANGMGMEPFCGFDFANPIQRAYSFLASISCASTGHDRLSKKYQK